MPRTLTTDEARAMRSQAKTTRLVDLTGQHFGRLVVIDRGPDGDATPGRRVRWRCRCECGNLALIDAYALSRGVTRSCGCIRREVTAARSRTHGCTAGRVMTREYRSWLGAKQRCSNPDNPKYASYGGRGISMCQRWRDDFEAFVADMGTAPRGASLDRIDVNGNYETSNCRWATAKQQGNNTRSNYRIAYESETLTLKQLAERVGAPYKALHAAVRYRGEDPIAAAVRLKT